MDSSGSAGPTAEEKLRFLKKIEEWRQLGFKTDELEYLLDHDFNEFLRKRHELLKYQVEHDKDLESALMAAGADSEFSTDRDSDQVRYHDEFIDEHEPELDHEPDIDKKSEEDLLLLGEPLPPEDEEELEAEEESVIFVGKFQRTPKSKVHKTRALDRGRRERPSRREERDLQEIEEIEERYDQEERTEKEPKLAQKPRGRGGISRKGATAVRRSRDEEPEEDYEDSELDEEPEMDDEEYEDEYDEEYDEFEDEEDQDEAVSRRRPRRPVSGEDEPRGSAGGKIAAAIVIIIIVLASFYFFGDLSLPIGSESSEKVSAVFEIEPNLAEYEPGNLITLDATGSSGDELKYNWVLDSDFKVHEGSLKSKKMNGYFVATTSESKKKIITLEIDGKGGKDSVSKDITIQPRSFTISEEKLDDSGEYNVKGYFEMSNIKGIRNFDIDTDQLQAEVKLTNILVNFKTKEAVPMSLDLKSNTGTKDGFLQTHSVYERIIDQNLELTGTATGMAKIKENILDFPTGNDYPVYADIDGIMHTTDKSYTDLKTYNTIYGKITNTIDITVDPQISGFPQVNPGDESFSSDDTFESYPDLQKDPGNLRIVDLSNDELKLGDQSGVNIGEITYVWYAEKIEYIYNRPAIKINMSIDDDTKSELHLTTFFFNMWIAEDVSLPVKSHLFSIQDLNNNKTKVNYITEMVSFSEGNNLISESSCDESTPDGHFYQRHPDLSYHPNNEWTYIPPTGNSTKSNDGSTSFDGFSAQQAINLAKQDNDVQIYLNSNSNAYVVSGSCSASGDTESGIPVGTLFWNLTFGKKNSVNGFNAKVLEDGTVYSKDLQIERPINSTTDFEPLLSFGGAEDILNNEDLEFYDSIFDSSSKIDFNDVKFGVQTNLEYPNVDITSIMFIESSRYGYLVSIEEQTESGQNIKNIALDAETGQLLYYLDHSDDGFSIF
jgi:hypothetical protein